MDWFSQRAVDLGYDHGGVVARGVWLGEFYEGMSRSDERCAGRGSRSWLWTHLAGEELPELEMPGAEYRHEESRSVSGSDSGSGSGGRAGHTHATYGGHGGLGKGNVRVLTPVRATAHPLAGAEKGDLSERLNTSMEIVDLDLKRLLIHPMFSEPQHVKNMKLLLYNYLLDSIEYKQGFHEIMGMIYMQIYDNDENSETKLRTVLKLFTTLMAPLNKVFYEEDNLLNWEQKIFRPMLMGLSPKVFSIIYSGHGKHHNNNLIWIIRWTRLLFIREIASKVDILELWDHLLTVPAAQFPLFMAAFISVMLLSIYDQVVEFSRDKTLDHDDLIEILLLRYKEMNPHIDVVKYCQVAMEATEQFNAGELDKLFGTATKFLEWKYRDSPQILAMHQQSRDMKLGRPDIPPDPNRLRMEEKLKQRVLQRLHR